ncbi:hypothetical protein BCR44DRAFT_38588 [Catenaria anguillulae PL171]|uniref:Uncharacterized protein n=1 Tax=Catenaria anguillulae PL171 TaxID=765915 RepID=A0A1Y2HP71_9FUNG|nr:hypothetical protein BCR44DRAFT_38588 [Catenaria anguillulae PL171]
MLPRSSPDPHFAAAAVATCFSTVVGTSSSAIDNPTQLDLEYTAAAMDQASIKGRTDILTWWFQSGLELKYTGAAMETSKVSHYAKVSKWWKRSGLALPAVKFKSADLLHNSS